jgi:DMSO reductase family type II enzyme heme b subunit
MNRSEDNNRMLIGIIGGALLIVLVMIASIFIATRRPVVVVVPSLDGSSGATTWTAASQAAGVAAAEVPLAEVKVAKVETAPGTEDPLDPFWDKIAVAEVALLPQQVAQPMLANGTIANLNVQAVRDDQRYVWRLSWDQPKIADRSEVGEFSDAVAMQFPLSDGAPYTMGGPKMPVRMLHWKATWQKDIDEGFQDTNKLHPNADSDFYWFANGEAPFLMTKSFNDPRSKQWMIAESAGNPMADFDRKNPVEELTAHGFGSATHLNDTPSRGRGAWKEGKWYVVIDRPIETADPLIARFNENPNQQLVAFAVWDGNAANRGGRKNITNWTPMRIAQ